MRKLIPFLLILSLTLTACIDEATLLEFERELATEAAIAATQQAALEGPAPATRTPRPTRVPAAAPAGATDEGTWTVMLYQDADDEVLEEDIFLDLNEAEVIGSSERVTIVSQLDRFTGGFRGDGNWSTARRYVLEADNDLSTLNSPFTDIGEVNMADGDTLVDFVVWAVENYPADHYALVLSDHGMGWPGGWSDPTARGTGADDVAIARSFGDLLYLMELDRALARIQQETGVRQLDFIGFDACLMGHLEVFTAVQPYARYAVASQEVEPGIGWAYAATLAELTQNPSATGADLARSVVDNYIVNDLRIRDDSLRRDYLNGRTASADVVADVTGRSATLTAVDLAQLPAVVSQLDSFAQVLSQIPPRTVARARTYAQPFTSIFGQQVAPSYIDLAHFAALTAQESGDPEVVNAARSLLDALGSAILSERSGPERPGAYGISIYFPNSDLYGTTVGGPRSYAAIASRFADTSLWDDFLYAFYTGTPLPQRSQPIATELDPVVAPAAGDLSMSPLETSTTSTTADRPVTFSTQITGENLGYIYLFVGYYDRQRNAILFADQDFVESPGSRQVNGVFYPDWGASPVTLEYSWDPAVYVISDGAKQTFALLNPETYGASYTDATYSTDGIYTFQSGDSRAARLIWDSQGGLRAIYGFTNADFSGAPSEITPSVGDAFTILDQWYDLATQEYSYAEGDTLTFSTTPWTYSAIPAPAGTYNVGFIAEDLAGNYTEQYVDIEVR